MTETITSSGGPVTVRIRQWLETALDEGATELDAAARFLEVSPRTLRRRLHGEGETFQGLLDSVRRERALRYLQEGDLPIGEVSRVLGFTRITSFYRAFRRWTGGTPASFRARHRSAVVEPQQAAHSDVSDVVMGPVERLVANPPMPSPTAEVRPVPPAEVSAPA